MPSRSTAWKGMPPATLASMARLMPARMARSQISGPHRAIHSLLAVTTDFLCAIAASMISAAVVCSAHQLGDDIDIRALDNLAPVGRSEDRAQGLWNRLRSDAAAADGRELEPESQFEGDLIGCFGKNGQCARAHIAQTDIPHTD